MSLVPVVIAIYLVEVAHPRVSRIIGGGIELLAAVPSIIYGMLGLAIFVRVLEALTSGALFGTVDPTTANGRTVLSAGLTLGLLILPIVIPMAQLEGVEPTVRGGRLARGAELSHGRAGAPDGPHAGGLLAAQDGDELAHGDRVRHRLRIC